MIFGTTALVTSALLYLQHASSTRPVAPLAPVASRILTPAPVPTTDDALASTDPLRRRAALRDWAATAPDAAAAWVLTQSVDTRLDDATALLIALADRPDEAARVARLLCEKDPAFIREHGDTLVTVLTENKMYAAALRFAEIGGPERAQWISVTLARWAEEQPQLAAEAALALAEPDGFPTVIATWSARDPAALAEYARLIPNPNARTAALTEALRHWIDRDPPAAAAWINHFEPTSDFDDSAGALATLPPLLQRHPTVAFGWAAGIIDPAQRRETLRTVVQSWAQADTGAVRQHIANAPELSSEERASLLAWLDRTPD